MESSENFALDIDELKHLQSIVKRPCVVSLISSEIRNLEKLSKKAAFTHSQQASSPVVNNPTSISSAPIVSANSLLKYVELNSFSWGQDNDQVKIYVSLEGIDKEKIQADFKPASFHIKFHDVQSKNYCCAIPKLNKEIVPEKCKLVVKPKRVIVTLVKASKGNWLDLHLKENTLKPNLDKERDPMARIMDLMKNMYEKGDDKMKRTIAKAWSDARTGKPGDALPSFR